MEVCPYSCSHFCKLMHVAYKSLNTCAYCERRAGDPAANVVNLEKEAGKAFSFEELSQAVTQHKPAVLFLCQVLPKCSV